MHLRLSRTLCLLLFGTLLAACSSEREPLPTIQQLPTLPPTDAADTPADPTPTREVADFTPPPADTASGPAESAFFAEVNGDAQLTIAGDGVIECVPPEQVEGFRSAGGYRIQAGDADEAGLQFFLPLDATPGTYALRTPSTGETDAVVVEFSVNQVGVFADNVQGTLELVSIASAPGEPVTGSFDFTAQAIVRGTTLTAAARGTFDFIAPADARFCEPS